jgi:IclR helix-turn-helix domain
MSDNAVVLPARLAEVEAVFQHWLHLQDVEPLHVVMAAVAANLLDGDPFWQFLVAPPSGLKTELIRALNDVPQVYPLSSLTAQTFASGFRGAKEPPSLLLRLNQRILTPKDFTTILTLHQDKRAEILAQLREIYDGSYRKEFGNGTVVDWVGRIDLISGVTPIIDMKYSVNQTLGERFLLYRLTANDPATVALQAMRQQGREIAMREELRTAVADFFQGLIPVPVPIPEPLLHRLAVLAAFTARARSSVLWDYRGEIEYIPEPEGPGRIAKQLASLARGLALVRGTESVTRADYLTVYRVAEDTLPAQKKTMLATLLDPTLTEPMETAKIAERTGYPTSTARRYLSELTAMALVDRTVGGPGRADRWSASERTRTLLQQAAPPPLTFSVINPPNR